MELLKIDGSYGEGGGQILRSSIALSCITKKPIQIENIRKKRKLPGLRPQHLMGVKLLAKICNARVEGLGIGSTEIKFFPSNVENKTLNENIGTAGSISLILQTLLPSVSLSKKSLKLSIIGGTDVPWSPTGNYIKHVLVEAYSRMGINFSLEIKKRGYYPKGGGLIELEVFPTENLKPIILSERKTKSAKLLCSYSKFSNKKISAEVSKTKEALEKEGFSVQSDVTEEPALDAGCSMLAYSQDENSIIGSDGLLEKNSNELGIKISKNFLQNNLGTDNHLSDMLVIPASLLDKTSIYKITELTNHLQTNLEITSKIVGSKYEIKKLSDGYEVRITGNSETSIQ